MMDTVLKTFYSTSESLGIEWAPLDVPIKRRLQTLAATFWICLVLFGEISCIVMFIKILYSNYWWAGLLYGIWMLNDMESCNRGGREFVSFRNVIVWRYFRDYFPIKLVKTTELDPNKNYLFASFPHGVICSGVFGSFSTNLLEFNKVFPGMKSTWTTLSGHFRVPLFREFLLGLGCCASSLESLLYLLDERRHKGNCVVLSVGGAAEALDAHPGENKIILSRRKGFIRVAMMTGASLVPVFSFGETDVFRGISNPENSRMRRFQEKVRQVTGIAPMFPVGRGMFQYSFGVVPLRAPVTTVVGAPLEFKKNIDPTDKEIDEIHAEFTKRLIELFESEKSKYLKNHEKVNLIIT